jgi:hypothetical protein
VWPNETVEKVRFSYFLGKTPFENQKLMSEDLQVLGFFDSLNKGLQADGGDSAGSVLSGPGTILAIMKQYTGAPMGCSAPRDHKALKSSATQRIEQ